MNKNLEVCLRSGCNHDCDGKGTVYSNGEEIPCQHYISRRTINKTYGVRE